MRIWRKSGMSRAARRRFRDALSLWYGSLLLSLVAFAVIAATPQPGDASGWHHHLLGASPTPRMRVAKVGKGSRLGAKGKRGPAPAPVGRPEPRFFTATSRTYLQKDGLMQTRVFPRPVNFRAPGGGWRPISSVLVPAPHGALVNRANRYQLVVPRRLGRAVTVRLGHRWVSFALVGGHGAKAVVRGDTARFDNVLPGASLSYTALAAGVKESLVLRGARAPSAFRFRMRASAGLRLRRRGPVLALVDGRGKPVFHFASPFAYALAGGKRGAPHPVRLRVVRHRAGWLVTVSVDERWLTGALAGGGRVVIDPSVTPGPLQDCLIESDSPTTSECSFDLDAVGWDTDHDHRTLMKFDVQGSVPPDSLIENAQLGMYLYNESTSNVKSVAATQVTKPWTMSATWTSYDGTQPWERPGGDTSSQYKVMNPAVGGSLGWYYWYPTQLVQAWEDGTTENNGLLLEDTDPGRSSNALEFYSSRASSSYTPFLDIFWEPRGIGAGRLFTLVHTPLTSTMDMAVNPASGNLRITNHDLHVQESQPDFDLVRQWDNLEPEKQSAFRWSDTQWMAGRVFADGSVMYGAADGTFQPFIRQSDGTFLTPRGADEALCQVGGPQPCTPGSTRDGEAYNGATPMYVLRDNSTGLTVDMDTWGRMLSITDSSGHTFVGEQQASFINDYVDDQGRKVTQTSATTDGYIGSVTDWNGQSTHYGYNTTTRNRLTSFTDPSNAVTKYAYASTADNLTKITTPDGQSWKFAYDSLHHVTQSTVITDTVNQTGPTTTYAYYPGSDTTSGHDCSVTANTKKTVVTQPNGDVTTYCANVYDEVFETWDKNGTQNAPPTMQLSGSLKAHENKTLYSGQYKLHVDAQDGAVGTVPSGVKSIDIYLDEHLRDSAQQDCPNGGCPMSRDWTLDVGDPTLLPGDHTVRVEATDQTGLKSTQSFSFKKGVAPAPDSDMTGLEDWFQYQSTDTGAGTRAHVNLANGNLVWHSIPLVNPGRGLSTFVNLTYNSETEVADGALEYNRAGHGFSLGVSGITRVNEPLDLSQAAVGQITLTDADGTKHVFRSSDGEVFDAPPGVNLRLRRFSDGFGPLLNDETKAWAATRPDGVTYYFDEAGYPTSIEDRNGNVIRYDYEYFGLTGGVCDAADPEALGVDGNPVCLRRLKDVTDPAGVSGASGRQVQFGYDTDTVTNGVLMSRVKTITDHLGVVTDLSYDGDGFLTRLDEGRRTDPNDGLADASRSFQFAYEPAQDGVPDWQRYMTQVTDPRGNATEFTYEPRQLPNLDPRRVLSVQDRREDSAHPTSFSYLANGQSGCTATYCTTVTDALGHQASYELDTRGRMTKMTDARGAVTLLAWDDDTTDDNDVSQITEAAGSGDEAVTQMTYNQNGLLTSSTDPLGHETTLAYRDGPGTQLSPRGTDDGGVFVSDLTALTTPRGNETSSSGDVTYQFGLDDRGNVTSETDPLGNEADTAYDQFGEITREEDWHQPGDSGNVTTYDSFDDNGYPKVMTDPRGNNGGEPANEHRWIFHYDGDGNLRQVTDPRGATTGGPDDPRSAFTTTLGYDSLAQLVTEQRPKDSQNGVFVTRSYEHDPNGNVTATVDGNGSRWETTYTAMDDPQDSKTPAADHVGASQAASEVTHYDYDLAGNLTDLTQPAGTASAQADDFSTHYEYDPVNEVVAEIRRSRGDGPDKDLASSYAYDLRGNVVGVVDPNRNTEFGGDPAANAQDAAKRRFSYEYDKANERTAAVEDPGNLAYRTELQYDADGNLVAKVDPRGTASGANPDDHTTHYEYDPADRLTATVDPAGDRTEWELRPDGLVDKMTKPKGTASSDSGDYETTYQYYATGELKSFTLPRAVSQYGPTLTVSYDRDPVGDPTTITDARGNQIRNTFFDSGELKTTDRPSFWQFTPDDPNGGPDISEPTPDQIEAGLAPDDPFTSGARPAGTAGQGAQGQADGPLGGTKQGDYGQLTPQQLPGVLPIAGSTTLAYDGNMALTSVTDAAGNATTIDHDPTGRVTAITQPLDASAGDTITNSFGYDLDGNLAQQVDGRGETTNYTYDQFDRQVAIHAPGTADQFNVTDIGYDDNGNTKSVETPRGTAGGDPSFTWQYAYDAVDRLTSQTDPENGQTSYGYDPADNVLLERSPNGNALAAGDPNRSQYETHYAYDNANRLTQQSDGLGNQTNYGYDQDGNLTSIDAPGAKDSKDAGTDVRQSTAFTYDGRDLPWTTTTGTGSHQHTTVTEYDGNGNLRRVVNPLGVDSSSGLPKNADDAPQTTDPASSADRSNSAVTDATEDATLYEYSPDNLLTATHLPWGVKDDSASPTSDDSRRFRVDYTRDARGRVTHLVSAYLWTEDNPNKVSSDFTYFDSGWVKTQSLPGGDDTGNSGQSVPDTRFEFKYDKQGNQTRWCTELASESDCQGNGARRIVSERYFPSGDLQTRTATDSNDPGAKTRSYDYSWDPDGSLASIVDHDLSRTTSLTYDQADRNTKVNDEWTQGTDSQLGYDADGNVTTRRTDGHFNHDNPDQYDGGKLTSFSYDPLDRETQAVITPDQADPHTVDTSYYPSGQRSAQTTHNGTTSGAATRFSQKWFYSDDGLLAEMTRADKDGTQTKDQSYSYDLDGNRTQDERGSYGYNARDQLTHWAGLHQDVSYTLNGSGAITQKVDDDTDNSSTSTTDFSYLPNTDLLTRATSGGQGFYYCYTGAGDLRQIAAEKCDQDAGGDSNKYSYQYDGFDRLKSSQGPSGQPGDDSTPHGFQYDGLDRPYQQCIGGSDVTDPTCPGTGAHIKTESYIGMSPLLSSQTNQQDGTTQSFDYDSSYQRLGVQTSGGGSTGSYRSYAQSADGSVEALLNDSGQLEHASDKYFYDPYGELQNPDGTEPTAPNGDSNIAEGNLGPDAQANPFRFQGFYEDSGVKTYDMQARAYRPDIGRFLTQDAYEAANGDFNLEADPLTQDPYAFAGGNPVNQIEFDGHEARGPGYGNGGPMFPLPGSQRVEEQGPLTRDRCAAGPAGARSGLAALLPTPVQARRACPRRDLRT